MSVKMLTNEVFDSEVMNSQKPVLVDFFATWCGPCKMLSPIIEEISDETQNKAEVYKCDVDKNTELSERFNILSVPTCIVFKNGEEIERISGVHSKSDFIDAIENA